MYEQDRADGGRPHKEERMRYPIIAVLCVLCAFAVSCDGVFDVQPTDLTGNRQPDVIVNPVTGEQQPIPALESPEELTEVLKPPLKQAAQDILEVVEGTQWGQAAKGIAGLIGALGTAGAGIFYGLRKRKQVKRERQFSGVIVNAIQHMRQNSASTKTELTHEINGLLGKCDITEAELRAYVNGLKAKTD